MNDEDQKETISINNDLFNNNNIDIDNIPWIISKYVFENNHEHGYKLHKGDIFKLGKYILRVKELGIEDDKKHFFFENKNTQKFMKDRSINNASQVPFNQQGENYLSALNLNQIINIQRKEDENNINGKCDNNNDNNNSGQNNDSNNNENGSDNNENRNNENGSKNNSNEIHVNKNESNGSQNNNNSNSNSKGNENGNGNIKIIINNSFNPINLLKKNNEGSKKGNKDENSISPDKSAYYSNNQSLKNINNQSHYNEIISYKVSNSNSNKNNSNHFFINIITNNDLENINNNINALDDSKNKISNNSSNLNLNSLGFNTFHNNSIMNSSLNASGKNVSNFNNDNEIESSKKNMNVNSNNNNNNNNNNNTNSNSNNCHLIKSAFNALRSTASFKKKKLTNIVKRVSKNSQSITEKNNKPICRICLSEDYEENNPLIHPCNCDGTMKYIHLHCLKLLIQSKIKKTETESCKVFTFKTLECEICKMVFPEKIKIKGTAFYIIDFEKPDKDYIILDGLIKETPEEKSVFIVHFKNKKEIKIGRATDANIRLSDISVSRAHAVISQYNESFYLHDTNSKFGTLISAGNKFCILYNKPFSVQKGNILFEFMMKKTFCATLRCYHPSVVLYRTYNDFFDETFIYKYQTREESMLIPEKTKSVSEYSSHIISLKPANSRFMSSKMNDILGENNDNENELNNNKKKNSLSLLCKEDIKNSMNNNSPNNSNENNKKNEDNVKNEMNINSQMFESFKFDKDKANNNSNNNINYSSLGVNKTQEVSNIYQKNEAMKSNNSKMGISLENQGNENSLLVNHV